MSKAGLNKTSSGLSVALVKWHFAENYLVSAVRALVHVCVVLNEREKEHLSYLSFFNTIATIHLLEN